jgi:hypothetical protein
MINEGEIIRIRSHSNFTIIPNQVFKSGALSFRAIGLLCYILHFPDDWKFNKTTIHKGFKEGRDATINAWDELVNAGYIDSNVIQEPSTGKLLGYKHVIRDKPLTEYQETEENDGKPVTENPVTGKPSTENPELNNTIYTSTIEQNTINQDSVFTFSNEKDKNGSDPVQDFQEGKNEEAKPKEKKHPAQKKEKVKGDTLYPALMEVYYMWFKQRNGGIPPNILGQEGKALKSIVNYFKSAVTAKLADGSLVMDIGPDTTEDEIYKDQSVKMFSYILSNWNKLDPFIQKQTKLIQILSNLTNIINSFKNGDSKTQRGQTRSAEQRASDINDAAAEFLRKKRGSGGTFVNP